MSVLLLVGVAGICLLIAYRTYGTYLSRSVFDLDNSRETPANTRTDGADYVPTKRSILFGHHFTSIAGTGPIVGPAIAVMWGWLPALLWVVLGSIFVGAVHDLGSLVVSLRRDGRSIGDIAGDLLGKRARFIFLMILIVGLWIVLAIFGLVIAAVLKQYPAAITPVLLQIPLAIVIGLLIHRAGRSIVLPSLIALVLMYASVVFGDIGLLHDFNLFMAKQPIWIWTAGLLVYCYIASVLPVWVLLQPRDYINALQLVSCLGLIVVGLVAAGILGGSSEPQFGDIERAPLELVAPIIDWQPIGAPPMFPVLFITIACGACSGFHCLVSSGTTSKQIARETDAKSVGYGSMLTEGFLATLVIAACAGGIGLGISQSFVAASDPGYPGTRSRELNIVDANGLEHTIARSQLSSGAYQLSLYNRQNPARVSETFAPRGGRTDTVARLDIPGGSVHVANARTSADQVLIRGQIAFDEQYESWSAAGSLGKKVGAFVQGSANFVAALGIPMSISIALIGVMVASFAATTLDTACRLQRYVLQEFSRTFLPPPDLAYCLKCRYDFTGHGGDVCPECGTPRKEFDTPNSRRRAQIRAASAMNPFKYLTTTHGATLFAVITAAGLALAPRPGVEWTSATAGTGGLILWPLFGATNQLLAGFAFVVIAVWLTLRRKPKWFIVIPAIFMLVIPAAAMIWQAFIGNESQPSWMDQSNWLLIVIAVATLMLEALLIIEVVLHWKRSGVGGELGSPDD